MFARQAKLRVAIIGTNNDKNYSGGRYHGLILAYILARAGVDVTVVTNKRPRFIDDLEPIAPGQVRYAITGDFRSTMPDGSFDYVIVIPTGVFLPAFYEAALDFARRSHARPALINFESANWFNGLAPEPRDTRIWDYWKRVVARGGLVLSSAREADRHARDFYHAFDQTSLRFEVLPPPINSLAAEAAGAVAKDGAVLAFVRASDRHKGGEDLLRIDPAVIAGRILRIVAGGTIDPDFHARLIDRFGGAGVTVEVHTAIGDEEKFALIAASQVVLFPSRFEGFGYPPVEAAYAGTECVCYDLPVLKESVGAVAHMAPSYDVDALQARLVEALAQPERREELRAAVHDRVNIDVAAARAADILLRSLAHVEPMAPRPFQAVWGPFEHQFPDSTHQDLTYIPPVTVNATVTEAGDVLLSVIFTAREDVVAVRSLDASATLTDVFLRQIDFRSGQRVYQFTGLVALADGKSELSYGVESPHGYDIEHRTVRLTRTDTQAAPKLVLTSLQADGDTSRLALSIDGAAAADRVAISHDGRTFRLFPVVDNAVTAILPTGAPQRSGVTLYLFRGLQPIAVYGGLPPVPNGRRLRSSLDETCLEPNRLSVMALTDAWWQKGVMRSGLGDQLGAIVCHPPVGSPAPETGDVVRVGSGRVLRIAGTRPKDKSIDLLFDQPMNVELDGAPGHVEILWQNAARPDASALAAVPSDSVWRQGVWRGAGPLSGRCILLPRRQFATYEASLATAALIGPQKEIYEIDQVFDLGALLMLWLDRPIGIDGTQTGQLVPVRSAKRAGVVFDTGKDWSGLWSGGVSVAPETLGRRIRLPEGAAVVPGDVLVFADSGARRVMAVEARGDGIEVELALAISPARDGAPATIRFPTLLERVDRGGDELLLASSVPARPSPIVRMLDQFRRTDSGSRAHDRREAGRPRVLFASIVPPVPSDQGNRIVTRNSIAHLVARGFDVDLVLIGDVAPDEIFAQFGDRVRVFAWPFPDWQSDPSATLRRHIVGELQKGLGSRVEAEIFRRLQQEAIQFHPYFIVPDGVVRLAQELYKTHDYHSIVCNYTHLVRVAKELEAIRPLPPVAIITHDALSRLPTEYAGKPFDTMYRLCDPATERDVLNAVPGAVVLAISESEQRYFAEIGVTNPIELCEYDGLAECSRYRVYPQAFASRKLIFHASGNPMNVAALNFFIQSCWQHVLLAVPDAKLVICGSIDKQVQIAMPGVTMRGPLPRDQLMEELSGSAVAINPTLAGTGLKIKTVEAACAGIPSVCLPAAVEGLESEAAHFSIVAHDAESFAAGCIKLLTDERAWMELRQSALDFADRRFSAWTIYGPVDRRMGWDKDVEKRFAIRRQPYALDRVPFDADLIGDLTGEARKRADYAVGLVGLGEAEMAWKLLASLSEQPSANREALSLVTAELGLDAEMPTSVLYMLAPVLAREPTNLWALTLAVRAAIQTNNRGLALAAWRQLALAAPGSAEIGTLAAAIGDKALAGRLAIWSRPRYAIPLDNHLYLPQFAREGVVPDVGWAEVENWGGWTTGLYARLTLTIPPTTRALRIQLLTRANINGLDDFQSVRFYANGTMIGLFAVARAEESTEILANLPATDTPRDELFLEFFVANPTPVRSETGAILDRRTLGIALQMLCVSQV